MNLAKANLRVYDEAMKSADMIEGPDAFKRFNALMDNVLKVPHSVIQDRIQKERERSAKNPNKRGPKPKASVSRAPRA